MAAWHDTDDPALDYRLTEVSDGEPDAIVLRRQLGAGRTAFLTFRPHEGRAVLTDLRVSVRSAPEPERSPSTFHFMTTSARNPNEVADDRPEISSRLVRSLGIEEDRASATKILEEHGLLRSDEVQLPMKVLRVADEIKHIFAELRKDLPRTPGRSGHPDALYALIALAYVMNIAKGSKQPVHDSASLLRLSPAYVRDALHRARRRGLLGIGPRGRSGGSITPEGMDVLGEIADHYFPSSEVDSS